jgi:hypoxanthine phosphoribosyltransferase
MLEEPPREVLYDARGIAAAIERLADAIARDLAGREIVAIPILSGALFFAPDLLRALEGRVRVGACGAAVVSSYAPLPGGGEGPATPPRLACFPADALVRGRTALVLDTVVDTGATAAAVLARARASGATEARLACLVDKPARRRDGVAPDWAGFTAPDRFLVGYGLDAGGRWRTLPYVAALAERGGPARTP